jgi:hypothetical protein
MPSADQVPVKTAHSTMRWHEWVVLIAGDMLDLGVEDSEPRQAAGRRILRV